MNIKLVTSLTAGVLALGATSASAIPIVGDIAFTGTLKLNTGIATATKITSFSNVKVGLGTEDGDYTGTDGASVTMTPFTFNPFGAALTPEWTFKIGAITYSFDLQTVSIATQDNLGSGHLDLDGTGIAHITGFTDSPGTWSLTTQGRSSKLTFSAATSVPNTPDGGTTAMLLGGSLLGIAGLRRKLS